MSKNITIQEGGTPFNFSADVLRTDQVGGGHVDWVPKSSTNLGKKTITKDGTYKAADEGYFGYSQVSVSGIGRATGKKGDDEYTVTTEGGEIVETKIPSSIQVTTPPTMQTQVDGGTIDFSGIVVTAYDGSGNSMGAVPFNQLVFPDTVADMDKVEYTTHQSDLNIAPLQQPIPVGTTFDQSENNGEEYVSSYMRVAYYDYIIGPNVMYYDDDSITWCHVVIASANPEDTYYHQHRSGNADTAYTVDNAPLTSSYTYGGKTVYYAAIYMVNENYKRRYGKPPIIWNGAKAEGVGTPSIGAVAWTMVYGAAIAGGQAIPVQWARPGDGKILEASYMLNVVPGYGDD